MFANGSVVSWVLLADRRRDLDPRRHRAMKVMIRETLGVEKMNRQLIRSMSFVNDPVDWHAWIGMPAIIHFGHGSCQVESRAGHYNPS